MWEEGEEHSATRNWLPNGRCGMCMNGSKTVFKVM